MFFYSPRLPCASTLQDVIESIDASESFCSARSMPVKSLDATNEYIASMDDVVKLTQAVLPFATMTQLYFWRGSAAAH